MADTSSQVSGRRFLRPPSTVSVSRKSHSFNAADRNKIKDVKPEESGIPHPALPPSTNAALLSEQAEWRSKSLNAKHSFTQPRGVRTATTSKLAKKTSVEVASVRNDSSKLRSNSPTHLVKVEQPSRPVEATGKQRLIKMKTPSKAEKGASKARPTSDLGTRGRHIPSDTRSTRSAESSARLKAPASKSAAKTKGSGLVPPKSSLSRSASNSSRSSTATTASPDRAGKTKSKVPTKPTPGQNAPKTSGSMLGRLRKMGGPTTTLPNNSTNGVTLKQAVAVKSPSEESKPFIKTPGSSMERPQKRGLVPPSKLSAPKPKGRVAAGTGLKTNLPPKNAEKSGIKSTFQRAFGGPKEEKKGMTKSLMQPGSRTSPANKRKLMSSSRSKMVTDENEVIVIEQTEEVPKRYSGEETFYRRDKIDVQNLKNLLVRPYDNNRTKKADSQIPSPVLLSDNDMDLSDEDELSKASMEIDLENKKPDKPTAEPVPTGQNCLKPNYESGIRNIHLPSSSDERKPHKTATVAPFRRQAPNTACVNSVQSTQSATISQKEVPKQANVDEEIKTNIATSVPNEKPSQISVNANATLEVRRQTARGIADLRQNLEETMCSLRNSQLRNRMSDEFERRISAQLDAEIEEVGLPEVPPPLSSHGGYRSASALSGIHTISHGTRSPKLHAGECMGPSSYTNPRPRPGKFSSLQRTQSSRTTRTAWNDIADKAETDRTAQQPNFDEISSVSSEDLSEYIAGVSTDDISMSSTNNSPFHCVKTTPAAHTQQRPPLANQPIDKSMESLEKSSNSTTESNRSLSSWKKSKASLKSSDGDSKSKKKSEKKHSKSLKGNSGSAAVGSRLATVERSESPTSVKQSAAFARGTYAYRSLPRAQKGHMSEDELNEPMPVTQQPPAMPQHNGKEGFVRSPAVKLLLRSKANKSKAEAAKANAESPNPGLTNGSMPQANGAYLSSTPNPKYATNGKLEKWEEDLEHRLEFYNSLERKNLRNYGRKKELGISMSATQSLPRRFAKRNGNTTWSTPRNNANSAYSLPATPDNNNIYDQYGSYIEGDMSYSESANSFSSLTVPEYDNFSDAMDKSFHDRHKIADWPLSGLQPSSAVAASSPNVARAAFSDRSNGYNYRTISSTHDLLKRRGSTVSLGAALSSKPQTDETSIAMARSFLYSLAQNKAVQQASMVQEFEMSLSHLTTRLRELASTAEEKDTELNELRSQIEQLKRRSSKSDEWNGTENGKLKKKPSCGSLSSMSSQTSISSTGSVDEKASGKKKRHWLKNSFKSAFGRTKSKSNISNPDDTTSRASSPQKSVSGQEVMSLSSLEDESCDPETVRKLKEELRQKERKLTDIRLEALSSRHQLQHLQDTMTQMKTEMESLRKENEQLHQLGLSAYSLTSSSTFLHSKLNCINDNVVKAVTDELKVKIVVEISTSTSNANSKLQCIIINSCPLPKTVNWSQLDQKLIKIFLAYCQTIDPTNCLKLTKGSLDGYSVGDGVRGIGVTTPDLLPCGYLVGDVDTVVVKLRDGKQHCVDMLAFELLIDKDIVEKYVDLIIENQRVIISGPTGTGKSLLANRLAGYIAQSLSGHPGTVIHIDAKQKAASELQDFLQNISSATEKDSPTIIVLDNLQSCKSPRKLLEPYCGPAPVKNLYLICVTNQKRVSELQEFAWITCSNNSAPVQTFLARKLRRSYLEHQISKNQKPDDVLSLVITWLPKCWQHINDFLESHHGSDVTIGPRMFSSCPMDAASARVWFTDLWNFSVVPYVISAIKRSPNRKNSALHWTDPTEWVLETMPWRDNAPNLLHIRSEDVGPSPTESDYSGSLVMSQSSAVTSQSSNATSQSSSSDPLLNMLMRLQEAANYDSDTNSSHDEGFEISIDKALTELGS